MTDKACDELFNKPLLPSIKLNLIGELKGGGEYLERYVFISKYSTHAESWVIVQTDHKKGDDAFEGGGNQYLNIMGFQDHEGCWWLIWHAFVHRNATADEWLRKEIEEDYMWGEKNSWWGVLTDA
jgi:hypothetical protein